MYLKDNNGTLINTQSKNVISLLSSLGYAYMWNNANVSGVILNDIVQRIKDQCIQNQFSQLENYAKLDTYRTCMSTFEPEKYITCLNNRCHFYRLARVGCSAHTLTIEEGIYRNQERNNRICQQCNLRMIENEYHFLLICPSHTELRNTHIPRYYRTWPTITNLNY